jgi:hypothetical protein
MDPNGAETMTGLWLVSYVVLWSLLIAAGLVILALAREVEALHTRLDSLMKYASQADFGANGQEAGEQGQALSRQRLPEPPAKKSL